MRRPVALVGAGLLLLVGATPSESQIYRWVDEQGVSHFSEGLDSVPERFRKTAVRLGLENAPPASPSPLPPGVPAVSGAGVTRIKFMKGEPIVVDALINGTTTVKLILDTQAERTSVSPRALGSAGVSLGDRSPGRIAGAEETTNAAIVQLQSLTVSGVTAERLRILAQDVDRENVDGVLGRDVLDRFNLTVDSDNGIATLTAKPR